MSSSAKLWNTGRSKHDPKVTANKIDRRIKRIRRRHTAKGIREDGQCVTQLLAKESKVRLMRSKFYK